MEFWLVQAVYGMSYGMLLWLLTAGLSLVWGLMGIVNVAHGSYFMLGTYVGVTVFRLSGDFVLAFVAAGIVIAVLGLLMQKYLLYIVAKKELAQFLLTFGCAIILSDLSLVVWGGNPLTIPAPGLFAQPMTVAGITFPGYRLMVIAVGIVVALFFWWFQEGTKMGAAVRAAVDDEEMSQAAGLNVPMTRTVVFGLGAGLAALGGVMGGPMIGAYPGVDMEVLIMAFVVIIIGGVGSLRGAFVGAMVVGLLDNFGKALFPEFALFTVFAPMAIILAVRPSGLFGREL